ncbi:MULTISPECIES: contact-dependent growth inhibition system immunity protein [Photorhabdus]|uniref:Uncharacterized protein n=1 Tax=Photorhabdus asymbiotica TaxID=291112 RepID=A0ABX9SJP5_9GAMM|nr:contact-dependent growth inhibition system immunity protein [Photorhabdus asymbiotica]RKS57678.1 hypothetical protein BDD30_2487 [Photorhabdus asymbiotica]
MERGIERKSIANLMTTYFYQYYQSFDKTTDEIMADHLNCQYPIIIISLIRGVNNFTRNSDDVEKDFHNFNYDEFVPKLMGNHHVRLSKSCIQISPIIFG